MTALHLIPDNLHEVHGADGRRLLFHIPTTALFDIDDVSGAVLDCFNDTRGASEHDICARLEGVHDADAVREALADFIDLEIVGSAKPPARRSDLLIENYPLSTIVLNVNTGCNLGCSYCYKEDLKTPAAGEKMDFETARKSIDLLLREGAQRERINVVFFGGEPLSNLPLIEQVVDYTNRRCEALGKTPDYSLTTNATLLKPKTVDWLNAERFSIAVSMDGPRHLHDRHRRTVGGGGTYDTVSSKVRMLLDRYTARPVGARVTLTRGNTEVLEIHQHLKTEIGFYEVGYAPVTSSTQDAFALDGTELQNVFEQMKALGLEYQADALRGRNNGFSNLHQLMTDLHQGTRKVLPCGAGVGMLAVDKEGGLNLCHRFTGSEVRTYGDVNAGIDKTALGEFLSRAADRSDRACESCRIRNLCAGGCYHESYAHFNDPLYPTYHYCDILRDWVDFGIGVYANIAAQRPDFFDTHVTPRRAIQ